MARAELSVIEGLRLNDLFLEELGSMPEWEKIKACIQCGTCTASCPTSWAMEHKPREIIGLFRAGRLEEALNSNTVWICASCYSCTVRCPSGIKLSDIVHVLRSLGIRQGLFPSGEKFPSLAKAFVAVVDKYGRNAESAFLARFYLSGANLLAAARQLPLGLALLRRRRMTLLPRKLRGRREMDKMMAQLEREESR